MGLWCCTRYNISTMGFGEMNPSERRALDGLLEDRYKIYDDTTNKIVLACGTREDVLNLLLKEKKLGRENLGNVQLLKTKLDFKVFTDVREVSELTINATVVITDLTYEQVKRNIDYMIDDLKRRRRLDKNFSGKVHVYHLGTHYMDRETDGIIVGEHPKGYRFLNVNGKVQDIAYKDVKMFRIWNIRKGVRVGSITSFPKIELESKSWDKLNSVAETLGSNWRIGQDGRIVLDSNTEITDIRLNSLDGVRVLEVANTENMIKSLMIKTGPTILGKINSRALETVLLPDTIETIRSGALCYSNIKTIDLKRCKNLRVINSEAFAHTSKLEGLELPDTVEVIGAKFLNWSNARYLILPRYISGIDLRIFSGAGKLETIVLPSTKLDMYSFKNKAVSSLDNLREIWVEEEFYDSALNFYNALTMTRALKHGVDIVKVRRKT